MVPSVSTLQPKSTAICLSLVSSTQPRWFATRCKNAASVAGLMMITTEAMIADKPEDKPAAPAGAPGGMPDYDF